DQFGFVDGISQPVIRGTGREVSARANSMHVVNAGEFLFGYRDEHGFYPPSPTVPRRADPEGILRAIDTDGSITADKMALHDFGRNGSFMVVRQLWQHVERFEDYCRHAADDVSGLTGKLSAVAPDGTLTVLVDDFMSYTFGENGEVVGAVVRTRPGRAPLFVSPGNRVSVETAAEIALACCREGRFMPEPTRLADRLAAEAKRATGTARAED
ncbi:MAG TPA: endonuclease V, partial [Thermomicrobiales bacterium]|nr:endonuclease V [Thermomicrobiales bacterium]